MKNKKSIIISILCIFTAVLFAFAFTGCGKNKAKRTVSINKDIGKLTSGSYELPYEYADGFKTSFKTVEGSEFENYSTTVSGNLVIQLHTDKSVDEVKKFYEDYFATLPEVKAKKSTDKSTGWYDKAARLVLFNLKVWTADGNTVYSLGANKCEDIAKSEIWELK